MSEKTSEDSEGCTTRVKEHSQKLLNKFDGLPPFDNISEKKETLQKISLIIAVAALLALIIVYAVLDSRNRLTFIDTYKLQPFALPDIKICIQVMTSADDTKVYDRDLTYLTNAASLTHFADVTQTPQQVLDTYVDSGYNFEYPNYELTTCAVLGPSSGVEDFSVSGSLDMWEVYLPWAYIIGPDWTANWLPQFYQLAQVTFGVNGDGSDDETSVSPTVEWATASYFVSFTVSRSNDIDDGVNTTTFGVNTVPLYQLTFGSNVSCSSLNHPTAQSTDRCVQGLFKARIRVEDFYVMETVHESGTQLGKRIVADTGSLLGVINTILPILFGVLITKLLFKDKTAHIDHDTREAILYLIAEQRANPTNPSTNVEAKTEADDEEKQNVPATRK